MNHHHRTDPRTDPPAANDSTRLSFPDAHTTPAPAPETHELLPMPWHTFYPGEFLC